MENQLDSPGESLDSLGKNINKVKDLLSKPLEGEVINLKLADESRNISTAASPVRWWQS